MKTSESARESRKSPTTKAARLTREIQMNLDHIDLEIVQVLRVDSRAADDHIAETVGISPGSVRERVDKMQAVGVLQFNTWIDPYRSGVGLYSTLLVQVRPESRKRVIAALADVDEIGRVAMLAGAHDAAIDVLCRDIPHLQQVVGDRIESIEGVVAVYTHIVTEVVYGRASRTTASSPA